MPKKTIFIFSTAYLPFVGGAEVALKEITDRIPEFNFILLTAKMKRGLLNSERIGNIQVYRLGVGFFFDKILLPFLAFFIFFSIIRNLKLEIRNYFLWGIMASYGSIGAYFIKSIKPEIPFLLTLQEGDSEEHLKKGKLGLVGFFGKRIIKKTDKIQVISNYLKDFALHQGAISPIAVVPNGVDLKKYKTQSVKHKNLKLKYNIKDNEKIVITTSRLVYKNGIDILIKAINELKNIIPQSRIKLFILGDGVLRKELENLTEELNLKNEVIFLGFIAQDEIYDYLKIADVFVRPSRSEGLGNSFLEAMAAGIPVIGAAVGGIPDFLINGKTGLFCEADNYKDLAKKIKLILEDGKLREKIILNGKNLVEEKYDWEKISKKMEEIFLLVK